MIEELAQLFILILFSPILLIGAIKDNIDDRKQWKESQKWDKENMIDLGTGIKINKKYLKELGYRGKHFKV